MDIEDLTITLPLDPDELVCVVDALHEYVVRRIDLATTSVVFRDLDFRIAQSMIHAAAQAYTKAFMTVKDTEDPNERYTTLFGLTNEMWDFLASMASATTWNDIPLHRTGTAGAGCQCTRCTIPGKKMKIHPNGFCQCELCRSVRAKIYPGHS